MSLHFQTKLSDKFAHATLLAWCFSHTFLSTVHTLNTVVLKFSPLFFYTFGFWAANSQVNLSTTTTTTKKLWSSWWPVYSRTKLARAVHCEVVDFRFHYYQNLTFPVVKPSLWITLVQFCFPNTSIPSLSKISLLTRLCVCAVHMLVKDLLDIIDTSICPGLRTEYSHRELFLSLDICYLNTIAGKYHNPSVNSPHPKWRVAQGYFLYDQIIATTRAPRYPCITSSSAGLLQEMLNNVKPVVFRIPAVIKLSV